MKKRLVQILAGLALVLVTVNTIFIVDRFFIGVKKAEEKIAAYEKDRYMQSKHVDMSYDWYSGGGYIGNGYRYFPETDLIFDEENNELWRERFEKKMKYIASSMLPNVVVEADYSLITYYDGSDAGIRYDDLFIYGVYNTQPVEEELRTSTATKIIWNIVKTFKVDYNLCGIHIDYYDLSGVYRFSIDMDKETITKEMLENSIKENSFENNSSIEEKWQNFCAKRKVIWSFPVEDYEIALMGMEEYGDSQLVQIKDGRENILRIYGGNGISENVSYQYGKFENILGYDGFYVYDGMPSWCSGNYYIIEDGELVKIADNFGTAPEDCYAIDMDEDGITEFICNVIYGTGGEHAIIYRNDGTQILQGWCDDLADIDLEHVVSRSISSHYLPEEKAVYVSYRLDNSEELIEGVYPIELDKITFYPYIGEE